MSLAWVSSHEIYFVSGLVANAQKVLSGRTGIPGAEDTVFPCLTTVPALGTVVGSNHDLVIRIQDSNIRVLPHQHTPLRLIQRWFDHPDQSFFDTIFVYQKTALKALDDKPSLWTTLDENAYVDVGDTNRDFKDFINI